jgi:hypothetical protein
MPGSKNCPARPEKIDDAAGYWVAWVRPAHGISTTWRMLVACESREVCESLAKAHVPAGHHRCVLGCGRRPLEVVQEDYAE